MTKIKITLAAARVNAGMKQTDVAKEMGVSNRTVVSWEKGNSEPSVTQAYKLAEIYKIPMDYIFLPTIPTLSEDREVST